MDVSGLDKDTRLEIRVIKELVRKCGIGRAQDVMNEFGASYKLKHHKDGLSYRALSFREAFDKYNCQKVETFMRYCSRYYGVRVEKLEEKKL